MSSNARRRSLRLRRLAPAFLLLAAPPALARQDDAQQQAQPPQTIMAFEYAGVESMLVSEKDAALAKAFAMLPERIEKLRHQIPEFGESPRAPFDLLLTAIARPVRLAVTNKGFDPQTGMPGIGAVLSFKAGEEADARALLRHFEGVRQLAFGATPVNASQRWQGMTDLPLPFGVLSYGPRRADDAWRFEMIFGSVDDPTAPFAAVPSSPAIPKPILRATLDLEAMTPFTQMITGLLAMAGPQGQTAIRDFRARGFMGQGAIAYDLVRGYTDSGAASVLRVRRAASFADASNWSREPLSAADLAVIPADATGACLLRMDLTKAWDQLMNQLRSISPAEFDDSMAQFREMAGVDIREDLIAPLGDTVTLYVSDSTGGGSLLSGVLLVSLKDAGRFTDSLNALTARFNQFIAEQLPHQAPGRVSAHLFEHAGIRYTQLRFSGLPIPIEPTIAVAGNRLIVGATPGATRAAAAIALNPPRNGGLAANLAFASRDLKTQQAIAIGFIDTSRTMSRGYPLLNFITSAIANTVRSHDGTRDPGFILPTYSEFTQDVRPLVTMSYWDGDDLIMDMRGDRSLLVNLAALLGVGDAGQIFGSMLVGGGIGAGLAQEFSDAGQGMPGGFPPQQPSVEPGRRAKPY